VRRTGNRKKVCGLQGRLFWFSGESGHEFGYKGAKARVMSVVLAGYGTKLWINRSGLSSRLIFRLFSDD
jgi:hypothetical protein